MNEVKSVYAAYSLDENTRLFSSSGGVFTELAKYIIDKKGVVYGVAMSKDCYSASYLRACSETELKQLQGSKYVQAIIGDTYKSVKQDLTNGMLVLFTGTGCIINGLKSFLLKDYDNLICIDVICHGVPSEKLWRKYIHWREINRGKIKTVNFRSKVNDWQNFGMKEDSIFIPKNEDAFMTFFLNNYSLRPSCYNCRAKSYKTADITLGDFWGIDDISPDMFDGKGTSLVIIRTYKGETLFNAVVGNLKIKEVTYSEGVKCNSPEYKSVNRPALREYFYYDLDKMEFKDLETKYKAKKSLKRTLKNALKCVLGGG